MIESLSVKFTAHDDCVLEVIKEIERKFYNYNIQLEINLYDSKNQRHSRACRLKQNSRPENLPTASEPITDSKF